MIQAVRSPYTGSSPTSITVHTIGGDGDVGSVITTVSGQVAGFDLTNNESVFEFSVTYDQDGDGVPTIRML